MVPLKKPKVTVKTYPWWNWASYMFWVSSKKWKIVDSTIQLDWDFPSFFGHPATGVPPWLWKAQNLANYVETVGKPDQCMAFYWWLCGSMSMTFQKWRRFIGESFSQPRFLTQTAVWLQNPMFIHFYGWDSQAWWVQQRKQTGHLGRVTPNPIPITTCCDVTLCESCNMLYADLYLLAIAGSKPHKL